MNVVDTQMSFIEKQFPVSKVSKESYKERKANNGQTLTGLGKWWGRKPLILVRAAILGCLMPASDNPKADMDIFLKILSMDNDGLIDRKEKSIPAKELYEIALKSKHFKQYVNDWFDVDSKGKVSIKSGIDKNDIEIRLFKSLGYDQKLSYCIRPEQLPNIRSDSWNAINHHLGTNAHSLPELVEQLSIKRYGHLVTVGDCFSGGGSIPFEAARMGANAYGSDLNPIAGLLTWADINILGSNENELNNIKKFQEDIFNAVDKEIRELGIEENEKGDRAVSYLYCVEADCPECGYRVPLIPSLIIGKGTKTVAILKENGKCYDIEVKMNATADEMKSAVNGTVTSKGLVCPHCNVTTPISVLRKDRVDESGKTIYGLRKWEKSDFDFNEDDIYHERLYAIKYEHYEIKSDGKIKTTRYYCAPSEKDYENETKVKDIVANNLSDWQDKGFIPSMMIESGEKTNEVMRNRGWTYWHHLFNARQLFLIGMFEKYINQTNDLKLISVGILGINRLCNFNSKLSRFNPGAGVEKVVDVFFNQALNTLFNYGCLGMLSVKSTWAFNINDYKVNNESTFVLCDARDVTNTNDFWITDPPYADAVNYHELSEFFLGWDKPLLKRAFPEWYTDSKRILAVRGDEHFSNTMIEIYSNLTKHMPDDGMQIVMFTHSDPAVWAQLALIMWKAGLKVTAAWNIATETDASGLKDGNYVKGTVLLVLRKLTGDDIAFLDEINSDIRSEVKNQIASMLALENKEEPNFSDADMVLAAYAASLKVLTSYKSIEDIDLDYELNLAINEPSKSKIVKIIEQAKKIAYDCVIPAGFEGYLWKELTNAEKFYIKGLEAEKHGSYQISVYQEYARGFNIGGYSQLMANEKANTARLKTPYEMASRTMSDVPDFEKSLMRVVFAGIYTGIKEDDNPTKALGYIKNELPNYWDRREMIKQLLSYLIDTKDIDNMAEHWNKSGNMAEMLFSLVSNDSI